MIDAPHLANLYAQLVMKRIHFQPLFLSLTELFYFLSPPKC